MVMLRRAHHGVVCLLLRRVFAGCCNSMKQLLPGDICSITRAPSSGHHSDSSSGSSSNSGDSSSDSSSRERVVACDLLLLGGSCVVNEALLTGESVPQLKEAIDGCEPDQRLDINKEHRRHLIFGVC